MNKIDFSFTGGFPLDQDALDFLQQASSELLNGIYANAGNTPTIISGMTATPAGANINIANGIFFYQGELYKFTGGSVSAAIAGQVPGVTVFDNGGTAVFEDLGALHPVFRTRAGAIDSQPVGTLGFVPYSSFKQWHEVLGGFAKTPVATINTGNFGTPGFNGSLHYIKNNLTNTLHVYGFVGVDDTALLPSLPIVPAYTDMFTLPVGFRPATNVPIIIPFRYSAVLDVDDNGTDYITHMNGEVSPTGAFRVGFIKPGASIPGYSLSFNFIIPLD